MLVLSRRDSEQLTIGNDIVITIVKSDRGRTRVGIQAPPDTRILRSELLAREEQHPPRNPRNAA